MTDLTAIRRRADAATPPAVLVSELRELPRRILSVASRGDVLTMEQLLGAATDAADRIEALERALVTARTALDKATKVIRVSDGEGHWVHVYRCCRQSFDHDHAPDCKRQQALTEIAGVMDAEPCKHERWVTEVEWSDPKYQGDYWKPAKRRTTGSVTKQDVFCASCCITADKVTP